MKGTNNGQRRRNAIPKGMNAFVTSILKAGDSFKDHRGQAYTKKFVGGHQITIDNPEYDPECESSEKKLKVWKGGGWTHVKGAVVRENSDVET